MSRFETSHRFDAPPQQVWDLLTHHEGMVRWSPLKRVELTTEGSPHPDGLGAVRKMMGAGPTIIEEVVAWEPPERYAYELRAGVPIRNHRGTVSLVPDGAGTLVTWAIRFDPVIPGTGRLVTSIIALAIGSMLKRAAQLV